MTDRYNSLTVVLDRNIRCDDAQGLMQAIKQLRGVISVSGNVADLTGHIAEQRAVAALRDKIWNVFEGIGD